MAVSLRMGSRTELGNYRENNEDAVAVRKLPDFTICIVADGMGGQNAGEKASGLAVEVIPRDLDGQVQAAKSPEDIRKAVRKSVVQANEEIIKIGQLDRDFRNMGTTVVLSLWVPGFRDDVLFIAGVGDSRCYLIRNDKIEQWTTDHSLAQALVEAKTISVEEAREHRFRNVLWKYLGSREVGDGPDVKTLFSRPGDRLLLCTDGLSGVVSDEKLQSMVQEYDDPQECAEALCKTALDMGSRDNVSCIVIHVDESK
jgi:protein phosphatase